MTGTGVNTIDELFEADDAYIKAVEANEVISKKSKSVLFVVLNIFYFITLSFQLVSLYKKFSRSYKDRVLPIKLEKKMIKVYEKGELLIKQYCSNSTINIFSNIINWNFKRCNSIIIRTLTENNSNIDTLARNNFSGISKELNNPSMDVYEKI